MQFPTPSESLSQNALNTRSLCTMKHKKQRVVYKTWERRLPILSMVEKAPETKENRTVEEKTRDVYFGVATTSTHSLMIELETTYTAISAAIFTSLGLPITFPLLPVKRNWVYGLQELGNKFADGSFSPHEFKGILTTLLRHVETLEKFRERIEDEVGDGKERAEMENMLEGWLGVLEKGFEDLEKVIDGEE